MSAETASNPKLEIGHVLFIDIIGYSKLLITEQSELLRKLTEIVRATDQFQIAESEGKLVRLPTGDGMALVFRNSPEAPVQCALELSEKLKADPELRVRMGIHSGPVNEVADVNDRINITGAGINIAQRVMDCGDAGHILLSKRVADDLEQYPQWRSCLHDLGECEVKHGVRISVTNLYTNQLGNPELPKKFKEATTGDKGEARARIWPWALAAASLIVLALAFFAFQSMRKNSNENQQAGGAAARIVKSIAVLPFENLSSDPDNAFFADGMQDQILTDLAKIADLKVISRTSVMPYKTGVARKLREIGQQLGVAHLLEGSVQRAANRVRVNVQLIDARSDTHLWAQSYDRDLADVFAIQSEIAKAIVEQLQAKLSPTEALAIAKPPTTDLAAYDLYLRAVALYADSSDVAHSKVKLPKAAELLNEAVARDPQFLLGFCLLAHRHGSTSPMPRCNLLCACNQTRAKRISL
jgi:adenylate cyclase